MQDAGVRELVRRVLERHKEDEPMLDAYWQWASNPTPPSAGYALEENCGFIATNLLTRYEKPSIELVSRLGAECAELRQEASVCDLRHAILSVLNGEVGQVLRDGIVRRLNQVTPARHTLALWLAVRARWQGCSGREPGVAGEYDWSLGMDLEGSGRDLRAPLVRALCGPEAPRVDLMREAVLVGIVNRLFYRNLSGRMEPKVRPGPRILLSLVTY